MQEITFLTGITHILLGIMLLIFNENGISLLIKKIGIKSDGSPIYIAKIFDVGEWLLREKTKVNGIETSIEGSKYAVQVLNFEIALKPDSNQHEKSWREI